MNAFVIVDSSISMTVYLALKMGCSNKKKIYILNSPDTILVDAKRCEKRTATTTIVSTQSRSMFYWCLPISWNISTIAHTHLAKVMEDL